MARYTSSMGNPASDRWLLVILVAAFLLGARYIDERMPGPVSRVLVTLLPATLGLAVLLAILQHLGLI